MDLFEQFGITAEMQQYVTLFSLALTVAYPLVRWVMFPAVRWVFKRRPRSELFQAIVKRMELAAMRLEGRWLQFGELEVDVLSTSAPIIKWHGNPIDEVMSRSECLAIHKMAKEKNKDRIKRSSDESTKRFLSEIQNSAIECGPFHSSNWTTVEFTPASPPVVEADIDRKESVEAVQPAQGDESVKDEQIANLKQTISNLQKANDDWSQYSSGVCDDVRKKTKEIEELTKQLGEAGDKFHEVCNRVDKLKDRVEQLTNERDKFHHDWKREAAECSMVRLENERLEKASKTLTENDDELREGIKERETRLENQRLRILDLQKELESRTSTINLKVPDGQQVKVEDITVAGQSIHWNEDKLQWEKSIGEPVWKVRFPNTLVIHPDHGNPNGSCPCDHCKQLKVPKLNIPKQT